MSDRENVVDTFSEERARGSAEEFFRRRTDHDSARFTGKEEEAIFHACHDGIHVFAHGAEDFVHAAQLLPDLGDLAADRAEFVGAGDEAFHLGSGHIKLSRGDAIQLIRYSAQRSERRAADDCRESRGDNEREENDRADLFDGWQNVVEQQAGRNGDAHFTERLTALAERESEFVDFRQTRENSYLMQEAALRQLGKWRAMRQEFALRRFVG